MGVSHAVPAHHFGDKTGHFTVMYDVRLSVLTDQQLIHESSIASEVLRESVRRATGTRRDPKLTAQTTAAWAFVHGLATLWLTGNLPYPRDPNLVDSVVPALEPALLWIAEASVKQL